MSTLAMPSPDPSPTIRDYERQIENVFDRVRLSSEKTSHTEALELLSRLRDLIAPINFRCGVQLEEDGRKKRSTATAANWKFDTGEVVIFFEQLSSVQEPLSTSVEQKAKPIIPMPDMEAAQEEVSSGKETDLQQCCQALSDAEKAGKQFIALKWFRDLALPALPYEWARNADSRQRVLAIAIDCGAIQIKKIPNPKSPMHPTTTIALNRASSIVSVPSRFNPVPIKGEPASATLLRDRGTY